MRKHDCLPREPDLERIIIECHLADPYLILAVNPAASEQRPHPQNQFFQINRFGHIIVCARLKPFFFVRELGFGGRHQYRYLHPIFPELPNQRITVHPWHHDVNDHQVDRLLPQ